MARWQCSYPGYLGFWIVGASGDSFRVVSCFRNENIKKNLKITNSCEQPQQQLNHGGVVRRFLRCNWSRRTWLSNLTAAQFTALLLCWLSLSSSPLPPPPLFLHAHVGTPANQCTLTQTHTLTVCHVHKLTEHTLTIPIRNLFTLVVFFLSPASVMAWLTSVKKQINLPPPHPFLRQTLQAELCQLLGSQSSSLLPFHPVFTF